MRKEKQKKREVFLKYQKDLALKSAVQRRSKRARRAARYKSNCGAIYEPRLKRKVQYFPSPEKINLSSDYDETISFLMNFRTWSNAARRSSFYVDLRPLKEISPAGALLLAAEFDRWMKLHGKRLRAVDASEWNPSVRALLREMGFFSLLSVNSVVEDDANQVQERAIVFLPFSSGVDTDGSNFIRLRDLIEKAVGRLSPRLVLFQGVSEAITNVVHHAYTKKRGLERWWMSASINFKSSIITLMVLDHGVGIPRTLPRKTLRERVRKHLNVATLDGFSDDAMMIDAAVALGRSSTGKGHRGHGLHRDIQKVVRDLQGVGRLRIHSNRGSYKYSKDSNGKEDKELHNFSSSLGGTFVEWKFEPTQLGLDLT